MGNHATVCLVNRTPTQKVDLQSIKYLALGIGSIRGVALLGAYQRLLELGLPPIRGISGSSVGCIMGLGIILGLSIKEIYTFLEQFIQKGLEFKFKIEKSCNKLSFIDNEQLRTELVRLLQMKGLSGATNFKDLYEKSNIDYRVVAYNLQTEQTETFSYMTTPTDLIVTAVMASSSIPFVFKPERLNDICYIDGGVGKEIPFYEFPRAETLGLYLFDSYRSQKIAKEFFPSLTDDEKDHIISIDVSRVKTTHFQLTSAMKAWLLRQGRLAVDNYVGTME